MENRGPSFRETIGHKEMEETLAPYLRSPENFVQAMVRVVETKYNNRLKGIDHDELVLSAYETAIMDAVPKLEKRLNEVGDTLEDKERYGSSFIGQRIIWILSNEIKANCKQKEISVSGMMTDNYEDSQQDILDKIMIEQSPDEEEGILNGLDEEEMISDLVKIIHKSTDEETAERYLRIVELIMEGENNNTIAEKLNYAGNPSISAALDNIKNYLLNDPEFVSKWGSTLPYTDPSIKLKRESTIKNEPRLFDKLMREVEVKTVPINFESIPLDRLSISPEDIKPDTSRIVRDKLNSYVDDYLKAEFDATISRSTRWRIVQKLLEREDSSAQIGRRNQMADRASEQTSSQEAIEV